MSKQLSMPASVSEDTVPGMLGTHVSGQTGSKLLGFGVPETIQQMQSPEQGSVQRVYKALSKDSKQLDVPVEDDTLIGGFSNLRGASLEGTKTWSNGMKRIMGQSQEKQSRGAQAEAMFGTIGTHSEYGDGFAYGE